MRSKLIILFSCILIITAAFTTYYVLKSSYQGKNQELYDSLIAKMEEGGKIHIIMPDIEHLLNRPFLQRNIHNNVNILGAYINSRMEKFENAEQFFKEIKLEGSALDIEDHIYYAHGKNLWSLYKKNNDLKYLPDARKCFKKVMDFKKSPMKNHALVEYVKSCYYSDDFSYFDSITDEFIEEMEKFNKSAIPEFLFMMGEANRKKDHREKSVEYFVRLWKKYPYSKWAEKAEKELDEYGRLSQINYPAVPAGELLDIYHLICQKNWKKSKMKYVKNRLDVLMKEAKKAFTPVLKSRAYLLYGKLFNVLGPGWKAKRYLELAMNSSDAEVKTEAAFYLMRRSRYVRGYASILRRIVSRISSKRYMSSEYYERTIYSAGFPFMRKKRYRDAIPFYEKVIRKDDPEKNSYYDSALWRLQWCYYHLGKYDKVFEILKKLKKLEKWEEYANYWTAYICLYKLKDRREIAKVLFEELLKESGFTYYGILAQKTLKEEFGIDVDLEKDKEDFLELKIGLIEDENRNIRFKTLKENGLFDFARIELSAYLKENNISREEAEEDWRPYGDEIAKLYYYSGKYLWAGVNIARVYKNHVLKGAKNIPEWFWKIYYPLFYKEIIDRYADKYSVSRNFLYAIIRQESFYDSFVKSYAGAIGVMQIMPGIGKQIFKDIKYDLGLSSYSVDLLYKPEVNIPMGIFHLKKQLYDKIEKMVHEKKITQAYDNNMLLTLTIASYNTGIGIGRLKRWLKEVDFDNQLEFIDQMDITQTRQYVKLVLRHRYLYDKYR